MNFSKKQFPAVRRSLLPVASFLSNRITVKQCKWYVPPDYVSSRGTGLIKRTCESLWPVNRLNNQNFISWSVVSLLFFLCLRLQPSQTCLYSYIHVLLSEETGCVHVNNINNNNNLILIPLFQFDITSIT
jgi:hypothetical protein